MDHCTIHAVGRNRIDRQRITITVPFGFTTSAQPLSPTFTGRSRCYSRHSTKKSEIHRGEIRRSIVLKLGLPYQALLFSKTPSRNILERQGWSNPTQRTSKQRYLVLTLLGTDAAWSSLQVPGSDQSQLNNTECLGDGVVRSPRVATGIQAAPAPDEDQVLDVTGRKAQRATLSCSTRFARFVPAPADATYRIHSHHPPPP